MPWVLSRYALGVLASGLVLAIACLGLNLLLGTTGLLSLGHAAYFGAGAYAGAFLFTFGSVTAFETYLVAGLAAATMLAALFGAVCVRSTRIHFSILTLAFTQLVHALFVSGAVFRPFGEHGWGYFLIGSGGLYIPRLTLGGRGLPPESFETAVYGVIVAAFVGTVALLGRIDRSPLGLALRGIRDNEVRAAFVGVPVRRLRWRAFVVSGAIVGLAGALSGQLNRQITPQQLDWLFSAELVLAAVLGGTREFLGPVLGALLLVALQEAASRFALYRGVVLGGLLIAVVFASPAGLAGGVRDLVARWRRGRPPAREAAGR